MGAALLDAVAAWWVEREKILRDPHGSQKFILAAARAVTCYAPCRVAIEFGSVSSDGRDFDAFYTPHTEENLRKRARKANN